MKFARHLPNLSWDDVQDLDTPVYDEWLEAMTALDEAAAAARH